MYFAFLPLENSEGSIKIWIEFCLESNFTFDVQQLEFLADRSKTDQPTKTKQAKIYNNKGKKPKEKSKTKKVPVPRWLLHTLWGSVCTRVLVCVCISSTVVLSRGDVTPARGHLAMFGGRRWLSSMGEAATVIWWVETRDVLNIPQWTGQLTQQRSAKLEKLCSNPVGLRKFPLGD